MISKQRLPTTKPNKRQVSTAVSFFESPRESIFLVHISLCFLVDHDTSFPCRRSCKDVSTNTYQMRSFVESNNMRRILNTYCIKQPEGFELTGIA